MVPPAAHLGDRREPQPPIVAFNNRALDGREEEPEPIDDPADELKNEDPVPDAFPVDQISEDQVPDAAPVDSPKIFMKGSSKSDTGVIKTDAIEIFTGRLNIAVRQKKMTMDRKEQLMYDIGIIADNKQIESREHDIEVDIVVSAIAGCSDFSVDLCVYHVISTDGDMHAVTMDVHHATCVARIANATRSQIDAVIRCLTTIITRATKTLEKTLPGG